MNNKILTKKHKENSRKNVIKHVFKEHDKDNNLFSLYKNVFSFDFQTVTPTEFVEAIRTGKHKKLFWREQISKLRQTQNKKYKSHLPAILTSCTVPQGKSKDKQNIKNRLPFIQIDFDHIDQPEHTKTLLNKDKYTFISFISPSGTGVKLIVKIDTNKNFINVFKYLEQYYKDNYSLKLDTACKNINRLMFVSYDKNVFYNENAKTCDKEIKIKPQKTAFKPLKHKSSSNDSKIIERHTTALFDHIESKLINTPKGQRHTELTKQSYLLGGYVGGGVVSFSDAESFLHSVVNQMFTSDDNLQTELKTASQGTQKGQSEPITKEKIINNFEEWKQKNAYTFKPEQMPKKAKEVKKANTSYDKEYNAKNYIAELSNELLTEITENKRLLVVAPTGTGKTYTIIKKLLPELQKQNKSVLLALPLRSLTDEVASTYEITALKGGTDKNDVFCAISDGLGVATYDKALQIAHNFDYVIIDEAHNFLNSYSYRSKTITNLWFNSENKNIIFITATPPADLYKFLDFRQIKINVEAHQPEKIEIRKAYKNEVDTSLTHVLNEKTNGKVFIKINSKNKLQTLKSEIIKHNLASEDNIIILDSNTQQRHNDKINYDYLVKNNKFQDNVKYILSTSYINDGFNIKDIDIKQVLSIETQHTPDAIELRQFIARFRVHKQIKFYEYIKEQQNRLTPQNAEIEHIKLTNETQKIVNWLNSAKGLNINYDFNSLDVLKISDNTNYNEKNKNYEVNQLAILYETYKRKVNSLNTHEFLSYLTDNYGLTMNLDNYNYIDELIKTEHDKEKSKQDKKERAKVFYDELKNNKIELFKYVAKHTRKQRIKEDLKELENITVVKDEVLNIEPEHLETIIKHYSEVETLVKKYITFRKIDLPAGKIINILFYKKNTEIKKRSDIKFNELSKKIFIYYLLIFKDALNDKISALNIDLLQQIVNVFSSFKNKELYSSEIKEILKSVLNESSFFNMYKNNRFYILLDTLFFVEKIKAKKDVYKYKITGIKKPKKELEKLLKKLEFSDTEKSL